MRYTSVKITIHTTSTKCQYSAAMSTASSSLGRSPRLKSIISSDSSLFTRMFVSGIVLAVTVYIGALATFEFFSDHGEPTPVQRFEEQLP